MDKVGKNTPAKGNCTCRIMEVNTAFVWGAQKQAFEAGLWHNQRNALIKAPVWGELEAGSWVWDSGPFAGGGDEAGRQVGTARGHGKEGMKLSDGQKTWGRVGTL